MTRRNLLLLGATALILAIWLCLALLPEHKHRHEQKAGSGQPDVETKPRPEDLMEESWKLADVLWQRKKGGEDRADYLAMWCLTATDMRLPKAKERCLLSFDFDAVHMNEHDCFYGVKEMQSVVAISYLDTDLAMHLLSRVPPVVHCEHGESAMYETAE